jgi:cell division septum initiation protein DivIVA
MPKKTEERVKNLDEKLDSIINRVDTIEAALASNPKELADNLADAHNSGNKSLLRAVARWD